MIVETHIQAAMGLSVVGGGGGRKKPVGCWGTWREGSKSLIEYLAWRWVRRAQCAGTCVRGPVLRAQYQARS
jgi:hypothetical protein